MSLFLKQSKFKSGKTYLSIVDGYWKDGKVKHKFRREILKHELSILKSFNRNPYRCPKCNARLKWLVDIT